MQIYQPKHGHLKKKEGNLGLKRRTEGFWILPTIGRPKNLRRLIESYRAVGEEAAVIVFLWSGDPKFAENMNQDWPPEWLVLVEGERFTAAEAMQKAFRYAPKATFYGFLADDIVFQTPFSQELAESAVPCFISYPDDSHQHETLCTHFVCGGDLVRELGYWALPGLYHTFLDSALMTLGHNVPGLLKYRPDVIFDHRHPLLGKGNHDEIYQYAQDHEDVDKETYRQWWENGLARDVKKLRSLLYDETAR